MPEPSVVPFGLPTTRGILRRPPATLGGHLAAFRERCERNPEILDGWRLTATDLARIGTHPEFGRVKLAQPSAT